MATASHVPVQVDLLLRLRLVINLKNKVFPAVFDVRYPRCGFIVSVRIRYSRLRCGTLPLDPEHDQVIAERNTVWSFGSTVIRSKRP